MAIIEQVHAEADQRACENSILMSTTRLSPRRRNSTLSPCANQSLERSPPTG